jgi:hypothetical protein
MAIESVVVLVLATAVLVGLAFYASNHRAEENHKGDRGDQVYRCKLTAVTFR